MEALKKSPHEISFVTLPSEGDPITVWHKLEEKPRPIREYLIKNGCDERIVNKLITKEGILNYKIDNEINPYEMDAKDLLLTLCKHLAPVYKAVDVSLNGIYEHGFNKHDLRHAMWVGKTGLSLLEQGGYDEDTKRRFVVAAAAHDLGNLLSRKAQSELAPRIFKEIFTNFKMKEEDLNISFDAIERHDEETALWLINEAKKFDDSPDDHTSRTKQMKELFSSEACALIIADKTAVGRKRLSEKPVDYSAVESTKHTEVNLVFETTQVAKQGEKFVWNMDFMTEISPIEMRKIGQYAMPHSERDGYKPYVSNKTHERYLKDGRPYMATEIDNFYEIYRERVYLTTEAALALFDDVKRVEISFIDRPDKNRPEDEHIVRKSIPRNYRSEVFRHIEEDHDFSDHPHNLSRKHLKMVS
jgi:hypothetical protein